MGKTVLNCRFDPHCCGIFLTWLKKKENNQNQTVLHNSVLRLVRGVEISSASASFGRKVID